MEKSNWVPTPTYMMRKKIILEYIRNNNLKVDNFLEIGIGTGDMIDSLSPYFVSGIGTDIGREAIELAKHNISDSKIKFELKDIFESQEKDKYQLIVALEVIEHIEDDKGAINKINDLLTEDGKFIMSVPAHQRKWSIMDRWAGHYRRYEKKDLIKLFEENGFEVEKFYNYGFPLTNMLWFIRKRLEKSHDIMNSKIENTTRSGIDRHRVNKFSFLFKDFFVMPFYILQKLFVNFDFSPSYLVIVKKKKG
jgi:SAM-dependent methyltransferase